MKHISDLFARYAHKIQAPQGSVIKVFSTICTEEFKLPIKVEHCSYTVSTKTLYLKAPSLLKSELLQKKPQVLAALRQQLGQSAPVDII